MKNATVLFSGILLMSTFVQAQTQATAKENAQSSAQARGASDAAMLTAGIQMSAELLTQLDAKKAKPGDEFKLRTVKPVMVGGKRVVNKGTLLVGRIAEVTKAEGKRGTSQMKLTFDEIRNKDLTVPFSATLEQVTQVALRNEVSSDDLSVMTQSSGSAHSQTRASGGSLLGGVTNTVGSTVGTVTNTATGTVASATDMTEQTLGRVIASSSGAISNTASMAGKGTGLIAISSNTSAEAGASSTLSLTGKDVRIEKGAIFTLRTDKSVKVSGRK